MSSQLDLEKARRLVMLKLLKSTYEKNAETLGSEIAKLSNELNGNLTECDTNELRISPMLGGKLIFPDGKSRILRPDTKYKPTIRNEPAFFAWLKAQKCDNIIKTTVHAKTLETFVEERKKNNLELPLPEILSVFSVDTVNVTVGKEK